MLYFPTQYVSMHTTQHFVSCNIMCWWYATIHIFSPSARCAGTYGTKLIRSTGMHLARVTIIRKEKKQKQKQTHKTKQNSLPARGSTKQHGKDSTLEITPLTREKTKQTHTQTYKYAQTKTHVKKNTSNHKHTQRTQKTNKRNGGSGRAWRMKQAYTYPRPKAWELWRTVLLFLVHQLYCLGST